VINGPPELFKESAKCDTMSDVWALGATLFALRTGHYPFVNDADIAERRLINSELRDGSMSEVDARKRKDAIDSKIRGRITSASAETDLLDKLRETVRGRSNDILVAMLRFDPGERSSAKDAEVAWSSLARELTIPTGPEMIKGKWDQIKGHLQAVERNETRLTTKQLDRIISDYETADVQDVELAASIRRVKKLLGTKRRPK